ncbi:Uncharacterised protein [Legionella beliardensis]|uniref:CopG family transcriptional regulator n=1 Tax=Legionella beliardensis TaxID=91822 RepID=A0A378JTK1_9GAMM|nr:CopG family transcriptional regulator [Legionella beliardensis]STX55599.1 Uncharacterised protein [Legionella beliardensis]
MSSQKLSISLPKFQCEFIEYYQIAHEFKTRSDVIKEALYLLQQKELESYYKEASQEIQEDFEHTALDGLEENET